MPLPRTAIRIALAVALPITVVACGGGDGDGSAPAPTASTPTTSPPSPSTRPGPEPPVSASELARAREAVVTFVDALGRGDVDTAASVVGPASEQRAGAAGGLESLLRVSTEGHGAWSAASGRTVTPVGIAPGLVVVVLEGTLPIEGTTEHRVAAFPVRRAESAQTVWASFDARPPERHAAASGQVTIPAPDEQPALVTLLAEAGPTLVASAFVVRAP